MSEPVLVNGYVKSTDKNTKLSAHFKVSEFACKDGTEAIFIAPQLIDVLQKIRTHFGKAVVINSGYRTSLYNSKVGGVANSQHVLGTAADVVVYGVEPKVVAAYVETLLPSSGGIGIYSGFTHVDVRKKRSRWYG